MKNTLFLLFIAVVFSSQAQTYNIGIMHAGGFGTGKYKGKIIIGDSSLTMTYQNQKFYFPIEKKENNLIYVKDGSMIHTYTITNKSGRIKDFDYDTVFLFTPDKKQHSKEITYYAALLN